MAKKDFVKNFELTCGFFGLLDDEIEAMKIMARGNMDAAESFFEILGHRLRRDPRCGTTERIAAICRAEKKGDA